LGVIKESKIIDSLPWAKTMIDEDQGEGVRTKDGGERAKDERVVVD